MSYHNGIEGDTSRNNIGDVTPSSPLSALQHQNPKLMLFSQPVKCAAPINPRWYKERHGLHMSNNNNDNNISSDANLAAQKLIFSNLALNCKRDNIDHKLDQSTLNSVIVKAVKELDTLLQHIPNKIRTSEAPLSGKYEAQINTIVQKINSSNRPTTPRNNGF